jgi:hypothetical protein
MIPFVSGDDQRNRDAFDRWQEHLNDRHFYNVPPPDPNGRGWKTLLAMVVALACFPLFFLFLFWLVAGASLP